MRTRLLIPVLAVLLLVAACTPTVKKPDITTSFIGGNAGVNLGLVDGVPPAAVYDGKRMDFSIAAALQNVGEADVGPGTDNPFARVTLEGFLPAAFGLTPAQMYKDLDQPLLGSHKLLDGSILPGQLNRVIFEQLNYQERLEGNRVYTFLINFCYDYENLATVPICFKDDVLESVQDALICTLTGEKVPQNSGGPLHATSLVQNPLAPYKVMVNFIVEHVGTGDFYGRTADETCDPSVQNTNKYKVDVKVSSESPTTQISCSQLGGDAQGTITLFQDAPMTVTCTLTGDPNIATRIYTELLTIDLKYRYGEAVAQPIVIQAVGNR